MVSFFMKWLINIVALFVVIHTIAGVNASNYQVVIVAALIIGLLNAFLRPILVILTLPLNVFSLGLFTLVINAFMFYLTSKFVIGFTVAGFWSAFWAALLFSILNFILNMMLTPNISFKFNASKSNSLSGKNYDNVIDVEGKVVDQAGKESR